MILPMVRVRILGPRADLEQALRTVQDLGVVHLADPGLPASFPHFTPTTPQRRERRQLERLAGALDQLATAGLVPEARGQPMPAPRDVLVQWRRRARGVERERSRLLATRTRVARERAELTRAAAFARAFEGLSVGAGQATRAYHLVLRSDPGLITVLSRALADLLGPGFDLRTRALSTGEVAALLLVPAATADSVDRLLLEAGVEELPLPLTAGAAGGLAAAIEHRRRALEEELQATEVAEETLRREHGAALATARATVHDMLLRDAARERVAGTSHTFVLEGWLPRGETTRLRAALDRALASPVVVEELDRAAWHGDPAPVVLRNPRLFRPFEVVTGMFPLPRYGSIDPTPFVAVFFPMIFGLILGDIGYGLVLAVVALVLRRRSEPGSRLRAISEVGGAAAAFSVAFGMAFGEFFGDLGRHWFGLHPVLFDREERLLGFLGLAVSLGLVHILLGLVIGIVNAVRGHHRRAAVGRGAGALLVVLLAVALLAVARVLPAALITPAAVAMLVLFPVLIVAEGILAPLEFLSTVSNILSYARIMALGTASVMMAVVANRLAGTFGSVLVGVAFALLFHLVNFAIGVFAPTVHALRLHYVEFFGKFYSPGGVAYAPLAHWQPSRLAPR